MGIFYVFNIVQMVPKCTYKFSESLFSQQLRTATSLIIYLSPGSNKVYLLRRKLDLKVFTSLCNIHLAHTNIFRKTNISYPLIGTCTYAYQGVRNISFSETFAYVINKWSLCFASKILERPCSRLHNIFSVIRIAWKISHLVFIRPEFEGIRGLHF